MTHRLTRLLSVSSAPWTGRGKEGTTVGANFEGSESGRERIDRGRREQHHRGPGLLGLKNEGTLKEKVHAAAMELGVSIFVEVRDFAWACSSQRTLPSVFTYISLDHSRSQDGL